MHRVLLIVPKEGYRTADFVDAARALHCEAVIASDGPQLVDATALRIDLGSPDRAAAQIIEAAAARPFDAIVAADDAGVVPAALAAERLGLPRNPPQAAMATRDKLRMRELLAAGGLAQPALRAAGDEAAVAAAAAAIGLREGPVHAELRLTPAGPVMLELAARTIGGLCARTLRFGLGISLEQLVLRAALRRPLGDLRRSDAASGVMMLTVPAAGTLRSVSGVERARAVDGVVGVEITIPPGRKVRPLPRDGRYLGFVFARGSDPAEVEASLRAAAGMIDADIRVAFTNSEPG